MQELWSSVLRRNRPTLHWRINSHQFDITHQRTDESPVAVHFNNAAHTVGHMAVTVIDQLHSPDPTLWKMREGRWITNLRTAFPQEMNLRVDTFSICFPPKTSEYWRLANYMPSVAVQCCQPPTYT